MFENLPDRVSVYEVSPRDGLQNERATVPLRSKLRLIDALVAAGLDAGRDHELRLAQVDPAARRRRRGRAAREAAGGRDVQRALPERARARARARGRNARDRRLRLRERDAQPQEREQDRSPRRSLRSRTPSARRGRRACASAATSRPSWGCPYEGEVDPERAVAIAKQAARHGLLPGLARRHDWRRHAAADGAHPRASARRDRAARASRCTCTTRAAPRSPTCSSGSRWEFGTSTRASAAWGAARTRPARPGTSRPKTSSTCSHGMGIQTGIDLERLVEAGKVAESIVGRLLPGKVHQAGVRSLKA